MNPKINLLIICIGLTSIISAQEYATDKKALIIAGSTSFMSQGGDMFEGTDKTNNIVFTLTPTVNYFIIKNLFIGAGLEFSSEAQGDYNVNSVGIGPQIGYVFGGSQSKILPYIDLGIRYYTMKEELGGMFGDFKLNGSNILFGLGVIVPVKTHIGIIFEGGYQKLDLKNKKYDFGSSGDIISVGIGIAGLLFHSGN